MTVRSRVSTLFHKFLRIPYTLHTHEFQSPKRPKATYVFIHGIGNTLHSWDKVVSQMPRDVRIIGIDLLGFGDSPKPSWAVYNAKTQARSVGLTLLGLRLTQQPIIVGHSLGALVAVEVVKRYGLSARRLVLCSPPFYKPQLQDKKIKPVDDILRELYRAATKNPERLIKLSPLAVKVGLANKSFSLTEDNVSSYLGALEASIINQTALDDIQKIKIPIDIFYGAFDAVVIKKHITNLAKSRDTITATRLLAGHEVVGGYAKSLAAFLQTSQKKK